MMLILFKRCGLMASAHHAVSGELSMRDERRPGLDGPGRMVKSTCREFGPQNFRIIGFSKVLVAAGLTPQRGLENSAPPIKKIQGIGYFNSENKIRRGKKEGARERSSRARSDFPTSVS